jgi:hypothetical protein
LAQTKRLNVSESYNNLFGSSYFSDRIVDFRDFPDVIDNSLSLGLNFSSLSHKGKSKIELKHGLEYTFHPQKEDREYGIANANLLFLKNSASFFF